MEVSKGNITLQKKTMKKTKKTKALKRFLAPAIFERYKQIYEEKGAKRAEEFYQMAIKDKKFILPDRAKKSIRHPTEKKGVEPTLTHPFVSIGKQEKALLLYLFENANDRFNVKGYHRLTNIPRSTIYDYLNRLSNLGFIERNTANNKITEKGKIALEVSDGGVGRGVGSVRRECRKKDNLSTHYHKFKLPISDASKFSKSRIMELVPIEYHENSLHNLHQIIIKFNDATVFINPKQLIIHLYDIIAEDVDESDFKCLSRAIEYARKFMSIGIETEGMIVEEGHWARIESALSDFLYDKIDNRYFLDLGEGKKFWIDHSFKREDETNDKEIRKRIDEFLKDVINSDSLVSDIDKVTEALGFVCKLESARLLKEIENKKKIESAIPKEKPDYFG